MEIYCTSFPQGKGPVAGFDERRRTEFGLPELVLDMEPLILEMRLGYGVGPSGERVLTI